MPYVRRGRTIYKKTNGLVKIGKSKKPKKYLRVLRAIERGWKPGRRRR
jgi:hypothetical protein